MVHSSRSPSHHRKKRLNNTPATPSRADTADPEGATQSLHVQPVVEITEPPPIIEQDELEEEEEEVCVSRWRSMLVLF